MKNVMDYELKPIEREPITVEFSDYAVELFNNLVEKNTERDGLLCDNKDFNKCPNCGCSFVKGHNFCTKCGQRVKFVSSDIVPL